VKPPYFCDPGSHGFLCFAALGFLCSRNNAQELNWVGVRGLSFSLFVAVNCRSGVVGSWD
jgi:hypothetical protein